MGKSSKKSASKVAVAPAVAVPPPKSGKKGKRDAEEAIEKIVNAKKQKLEVKTQIKKKKEESSSSEESSDSEEEQQVKVPIKKGVTPAKPAVAESSSDETSSDDEPAVKAAVPAKKPPQAVSKNGTVGTPAKKGRQASSSDSSSDDSDEEEVPKSKGTAPLKKIPAAAAKKKVESSDSSDSDSSSDEDEMPAAKLTTKVEKTQLASATVSKKKESSSEDESDDSDDESDEDEDPKTKTAVSLKKPAETKEVKQPAGKPSSKTIVTESSSGESSDESSDDEPSKKQLVKKVQDKSSSEDEEESEEDTDVEMVDATSPKTNTKQAVTASEKKAPKTPATPQSTGSKTVFVGNLPFNVEQDDVINFFKDAGEVISVRLAYHDDGHPKGFCHVEFATADEAQEALKLNEASLMGRPLRLDLANERGSYTPNTGRENNSFQKGGRGQSQTVFVRGFDSSLGEEEIRSSLLEHFGSCGEISGQAIRIPIDRDTQSVKGMAYLQFNDADSFNKALELNGTDLGEGCLTVEEAKPRADNRDGGDSGRGGWRGSGGRFGRSGGRDGRGRGGRDGRGRGGRDGGRFGNRGRGRGPSMGMSGSGKKTTFDD